MLDFDMKDEIAALENEIRSLGMPPAGGFCAAEHELAQRSLVITIEV